MTKVSPYPKEPLPIILINGKIFSSFDSKIKADPKEVHNVVTRSGVRRISETKHFCEFNKNSNFPQRECYHITCLYKRGSNKTSILVEESTSKLNDRKQKESSPSLSSEERVHEEKAQRRWNAHVAALRNEPVEFSLVNFLFHLVGITFVGVLCTIPMTLVPGHDLLKCPEYWYEIIYHASVYAIGSCLIHCCLIGYFLNINYTFKFKNILT